MRSTSEISCDAPYLRVFLPDVLPDWEALRLELEPELDEGAANAVGRPKECIAPLQALQEVVDVLRSKGVGEVPVGPSVAVDRGDGAGYVHPRVLEVADLALGRGDRAQEVP